LLRRDGANDDVTDDVTVSSLMAHIDGLEAEIRELQHMWTSLTSSPAVNHCSEHGTVYQQSVKHCQHDETTQVVEHTPVTTHNAKRVQAVDNDKLLNKELESEYPDKIDRRLGETDRRTCQEYRVTADSTQCRDDDCDTRDTDTDVACCDMSLDLCRQFVMSANNDSFVTDKLLLSRYQSLCAQLDRLLRVLHTVTHTTAQQCTR